MKILYVAELVGKAGIYALKKLLPQVKEQYRIDFTIVCADGTTGGNGLGRNHAAYIRKLGADVITLGECCFYKKDLVENIEKLPYVLRPGNLNPLAPGSGGRVFTLRPEPGKAPRKIAVAVLLGQGLSRMQGANPFAGLSVLLERFRAETPYVVLDFHAWASGEKRTLFAAAAGRCTAVIGSHNRVQTADEGILFAALPAAGRPGGGTAVICDAGRTGSAESVGGADTESRIREYLSGIPEWTREAWGRPELQGVVIEAGGRGEALSIERIKIPAPQPPNLETAAGTPEDLAEMRT